MNATDLRFEAWLSHETGIDASSLGISTLERAVLERVRVTCSDRGSGCGAHHIAAASVEDQDVERYWQLLNTSPDERRALIEVLVVSETWFFRDREAFAALARLATQRLLCEPTRVLQVLSIPCSTGEEPYSIAMALLDAGIAAECFSIDAYDISMRAIEQARAAVYGRNAFRGTGLDFRERHFEPVAGGWRLSERVQQTVRFAAANLFELSLGGTARYDFIFCRNVLIYFQRDAQDRAIRLLDGQLAQGGTLFVGSAETGVLMQHAMRPVRIPLAFAFQRRLPEEPTQAAAAQPGMVPRVALPAVAPVGASAGHKPPAVQHVSRRHAPRPVSPTALPVPKEAHEPGSLDEARRLADAGQLDQAEQLARNLVAQHGPDSAVFYLLGLIADARGRGADAGDLYRKALYLEPGHYEALTHLAALLDVSGDKLGAQQLLRRAQRAAQHRHGGPSTRNS